MRLIVFPIVILLLQFLTYGAVMGVQWLLRPYWVVPSKFMMLGGFLLSNVLFLSIFFGKFRIAIGYLSVLWLGFLGTVAAFALIVLAKKLGADTLNFADHLYRILALMSIVAMVSLAVYNAYTPVVCYLHLELNKPMSMPVRVAVASDLHLGAMVGVGQLKQLQKLLIDNHVDILLLPGDIMDDNTEGFERHKMAESFKDALGAVSAVSVASLGNHDLYQTAAYQSITQAITDAGALLLNDEMASIDITKEGQTTTIQVLGRIDDHYLQRLPTADLIKKTDPNLPVILLDHRPSQIAKNSEQPIDLQVSGHTHNGQVFPANVIVSLINRVGYGYEQINNTHFVVSSGYGFWGVPFRIGSQSEIWVIDLVQADQTS